jgi:hypothetical protein
LGLLHGLGSSTTAVIDGPFQKPAECTAQVLAFLQGY